MTLLTEPFRRFPSRTLLETGDLPIAQLAELALREGQSTSPLHRVHRWFARRLGSQFRAILTALSLDDGGADLFWNRYFGDVPLAGAIVLDPFAGGGTSLVEASRCGAHVVGFDLDPVAASIARFELGAAAREETSGAVRRVCDFASRRVIRRYVSLCFPRWTVAASSVSSTSTSLIRLGHRLFRRSLFGG